MASTPVKLPFSAVAYDNAALRLLDQTKLPVELTYLTLTDYREVIEAIQRLAVRGAPAIGIAGAYAVVLAAQYPPAGESMSAVTLLRVIDEIERARPTAINLAWALNRQREIVKGLAGALDVSDVALLRREADAILREDEEMCARIGEYGAALVPEGATILTHCNTGALATGGIGTALGVIYTVHAQGKGVRVFADETRPLLQGARLTAWELQRAGVDVTLIVDSVAGMLLAQGKISLAIVGADRITRNGDTVNKIGTYGLATLCAAHNTPFYVAAPESTFDHSMATGAECVIEERSPLEVTEGFGKRTAPQGVKVYSPAFDITPKRLITAYITDRGILSGGRRS